MKLSKEDMKYMRVQRTITNIGGIVFLSIAVILVLIFRNYLGAIIFLIVGIFAFLFWRRMDKKDEEGLIHKNMR